MLPYMASYMNNYTDPTVRIEHLIWIPTFQGNIYLFVKNKYIIDYFPIVWPSVLF